MAASNTKPNNTNTLSGKVLLKETGAGIPDLLVVIYDIDPDGKPEENFGGEVILRSANQPYPTGTPVSLGDRIGSVLTAGDGSWALTYDDPEFRVSNPAEKRPDLQLMVFAPEDADSALPPVVLFSSKLLRVNSGRQEAYLIRITTHQLNDAKVLPPLPAKVQEEVETKIQRFSNLKRTQRDLKVGMRGVIKTFDDEETEEKKEFRKTIKSVLLPNAEAMNAMFNFVKEDTDTIEEVQKKVFRFGADLIQGIIKPPAQNNPVPGKGIKINLILTDQDKQDLQAFKFVLNNKTYYNIPETKIQELLFKKKENDSGINAILFSNNPISKYCYQKTAEDKCAAMHTDLDNSGHDAEPPTDPVTPEIYTGITKEDIPFYLEKILAGKNSLQFQSDTNFKSQRPDDKSVQARVDTFSLQKGPADTTAFYDFHSLQIAFTYVWQQLFDESIVNLSEKVQHDLENTGRKGLLQNMNQNMAGLKKAGLQVFSAAVANAQFHSIEEVPTAISAAFDISFIEYDALTADNKTKLLSLAEEINKYETMPPVIKTTTSFLGVEVQKMEPSGDYTTLASVLRDQGERIIDNIRINKPYTTNQLLKELQEKLLSKYEFTVFAADKDYHSINFGIMNTFRQKWEPISYQAGKLVKTIPLSPKEERKYTVKTNFSVKSTRKEAQKNNSSVTSEFNTTSRAESEIIAKAQDKSNFNMSVKLDYNKISSEVKFGKEAEKESSQTKKDFREAVIKAAQEFKEERSVEVTTEENSAFESTESGTIVNPNDELSVTYLFYELQRRYRISEQLYRVMPVVMVAQQVPSPDQITEAWIIAHDWILNRNLLDDSFRETLQYLAQKNVGDDFAIRELRKNLRQQRTLVNNLQIEFSKTKKEVDNKYASLQSKVNSRIDTEHDKRFYKWWWWWGQEHRPDAPPDPEMAKALEQAAADDHKHAVEQAEKLAMSVQREVNSLHQLTLDYNNVMREHLDRITQTRRLIVHIKNNILYYMQAIWSMEPPDQRFMRLYKVKVPQFESERTCIVEDLPAADIFASFREPGKVKYTGWLHGNVVRNAQGDPNITYKELVEVADLDTMLGFKGNYMIFPLKEHNALTELMAAPYIDEAFGAMDPDELSNINLEEFSRYICCLHDENPEEYERLKPVLKEWLKKLLADPLRNGDEIIVPTGSMFIEMLPSDKSLLEDFKLKHREWDVFKVQAEVRRMELENLRYAARLLNAEREDPDIDKQIIVQSPNGNIHVDVDNP